MCFQQQGMANPIAYSIDGTTITANTLSYQTLQQQQQQQQQQVPPPIEQQLVLTQQSQAAPNLMHGCHNMQAPMQALAGISANAAYQILTQQQQQQVQGSVMSQQQQAPPPQQQAPPTQQQPPPQQQQQQQQQPAIVTLPTSQHPEYACGTTEGKKLPYTPILLLVRMSLSLLWPPHILHTNLITALSGKVNSLIEVWW